MDIFDVTSSFEQRLCVKATREGIPLGGTFELTPICNMNCNMCYVRLSNEEACKNGGILPVSRWFEIIEEAKESGMLFLLFTGGEIFLYPDFFELYEYARKQGMIVSLNTNATLIDETISSRLERNKPRRVNVTLYGASNHTYERICHNSSGFDQAMKGIHLLLDHGIDVKLNASLVSENHCEWKQLVQIAETLSVPIELDTYMFPFRRYGLGNYDGSNRMDGHQAGNTEVEIQKCQLPKEVMLQKKLFMDECLKNKNHENSQKNCSMECRAGKSSFMVTWKGEMIPCFSLDQKPVSIHEVGFDQAWNQIRSQTNEWLIPKKCAKCSNRDLCYICAGRYYAERESTLETKYLCDYTNGMIDAMKASFSRQEE